MEEKIIGTQIGIYDVLYECQHKANDGHKLYHVKCTICGWETNMLKAHIGIAKNCTHTKKGIEVKKCLNCGKEIEIDNIRPSEYQKKKFCSLSCAVSYNNRTKTHIKMKERFCLNCGTPLNSHQTKYCQRKCQHEYQQKQWEEKWFSGEINGYYDTNHWGDTPDRIRTYLFKKYNSKCAKCGWGEMNPYSKTIPLEIEHIDGNYKNNRPENVTLLCPNCHSLTKTYRGANKGNGRNKTWKPIINTDEKIIS